MVQRARSLKSRCRQGWVGSFWRLRGKTCCLPLSQLPVVTRVPWPALASPQSLPPSSHSPTLIQYPLISILPLVYNSQDPISKSGDLLRFLVDMHSEEGVTIQPTTVASTGKWLLGMSASYVVVMEVECLEQYFVPGKQCVCLAPHWSHE